MKYFAKYKKSKKKKRKWSSPTFKSTYVKMPLCKVKINDTWLLRNLYPALLKVPRNVDRWLHGFFKRLRGRVSIFRYLTLQTPLSCCIKTNWPLAAEIERFSTPHTGTPTDRWGEQHTENGVHSIHVRSVRMDPRDGAGSWQTRRRTVSITRRLWQVW